MEQWDSDILNTMGSGRNVAMSGNKLPCRDKYIGKKFELYDRTNNQLIKAGIIISVHFSYSHYYPTCEFTVRFDDREEFFFFREWNTSKDSKNYKCKITG